LETLPDDPFSLFQLWRNEQEQWAKALAMDGYEVSHLTSKRTQTFLFRRRWIRPEVFALATADVSGTPSLRCVLMRVNLSNL
jgi:pyridoxine/pyridoxamine 5'-phosphate oxidase